MKMLRLATACRKWTSLPARVCSPILPYRHNVPSRLRNSSATSEKSYYDVLGVSTNASLDEVKAAYYDLCLKHHPDKATDSEGSRNRFHEIVEAYDRLSKKLIVETEAGERTGATAAAEANLYSSSALSENLKQEMKEFLEERHKDLSFDVGRVLFIGSKEERDRIEKAKYDALHPKPLPCIWKWATKLIIGTLVLGGIVVYAD